MKKTISLILGSLVVATSAFAVKLNVNATSFEVDSNNSKVYWTGKKVTGDHTGYVNISNGQVFVNEEKVIGGEVNMDMNTIVCTDLENETYNKKLVGHLKSDDFFSVENYPEAKFEIKSINAVQNNLGYEITGNLSMKGKTNEISFLADIEVSGNSLTAIGTASIDRTKWDIKYRSGKFFKGLGDNLIRDEFEIRFELTATTDSVN